MSIETVKMSSKGQIVIPSEIRDLIGANEGTVFAVTNDKNTVILKKIDLPSKEELINELTIIAKENKVKLQKKGFREEDLRKK
ncbi:AbrB/MazE/SpoVT family DNA-binding domain-containing protein [Candidatus Woesearchaeota archaeon]|nr:AbrB/MazE/SpoVT family DNA-binding domain-containing protein [Candidatus Woesearchaeota archaeon]